MDKLFILILHRLRWLFLIILILILDLTSKFLILKNFVLEETIAIIPSLNLRYARNYGIAFSLLSNNNNSWQHWFIISISSIICVILFIMICRVKEKQKLQSFSYAVIIGGALGNLFNRLKYGFVIDMIDIYINDWHFATFNIADIAICTGVILIMIKKILLK